MKFLKCCLYSILIAILIIILIKSVNYLRTENFENGTIAENSETIEEIKPKETKTEEIKPEETKTEEIINNQISEVSIGVNPTINNIAEEIAEPVDSTKTVDIAEQNVTTNIESKQEEIVIKPKFIDPEKSTIMDGPKFIPTELLNPWSQAYGEPGKDNYLIDLGCKNQDCGSFRFARGNSCGACGSPQYPVPFKLRIDPSICKNKDKYAPNPYMGSNGWDNSGQLCQTKENLNMLANRGGNA